LECPLWSQWRARCEVEPAAEPDLRGLPGAGREAPEDVRPNSHALESLLAAATGALRLGTTRCPAACRAVGQRTVAGCAVSPRRSGCAPWPAWPAGREAPKATQRSKPQSKSRRLHLFGVRVFRKPAAIFNLAQVCIRPAPAGPLLLFSGVPFAPGSRGIWEPSRRWPSTRSCRCSGRPATTTRPRRDLRSARKASCDGRPDFPPRWDPSEAHRTRFLCRAMMWKSPPRAPTARG